MINLPHVYDFVKKSSLLIHCIAIPWLLILFFLCQSMIMIYILYLMKGRKKELQMAKCIRRGTNTYKYDKPNQSYDNELDCHEHPEYPTQGFTYKSWYLNKLYLHFLQDFILNGSVEILLSCKYLKQNNVMFVKDEIIQGYDKIFCIFQVR